MDDLKKEVGLIPKECSKELINGYSVVDGTTNFANKGSHNSLIFQPIYKTFRMPTGDTETIIAWKFKGFSKESIKPPTMSGNSLAVIKTET